MRQDRRFALTDQFDRDPVFDLPDLREHLGKICDSVQGATRDEAFQMQAIHEIAVQAMVSALTGRLLLDDGDVDLLAQQSYDIAVAMLEVGQEVRDTRERAKVQEEE